jgi:hypothetical protein
VTPFEPILDFWIPTFFICGMERSARAVAASDIKAFACSSLIPSLISQQRTRGCGDGTQTSQKCTNTFAGILYRAGRTMPDRFCAKANSTGKRSEVRSRCGWSKVSWNVKETFGRRPFVSSSLVRLMRLEAQRPGWNAANRARRSLESTIRVLAYSFNDAG